MREFIVLLNKNRKYVLFKLKKWQVTAKKSVQIWDYLKCLQILSVFLSYVTTEQEEYEFDLSCNVDKIKFLWIKHIPKWGICIFFVVVENFVHDASNFWFYYSKWIVILLET